MKLKILLILTILLGLFLRIWQVDKFPKTLYGDEQAFAWNAYNILMLGQDEYGTPYPLQFRSFDDYKAPIPVYLLVPFLKIWGLTPFAIRLPVVLASIATIIATYFLGALFFRRKIVLLAVFLLAVSPWHIHLSRGFFESTLALLWFVLGVYLILKSKDKLPWLILGMLFLGLSVYSYFTPRILVPIFLVFLFVWRRYFGTLVTDKISSSKNFITGVVFLSLLSLPLVKATVFDQGFSRFNKLTESNIKTVEETVRHERNATNLSANWSILFHNKAVVWGRLIKNNYLDHLSANFWYIYGDNSLRYFTGNMGMFYLLEFPFLVVGLYYLWKGKKAAAIFVSVWILLAAIPASLVGRPFAVRSLAILPVPFFIVGYGIYQVLSFLNSGKLRSLFILAVTLGFMISLGSLLIRYYLEYPVYAATWWGWENKAALDLARANQLQYDNIFISDFYTGSTLAFAVYNQYDPTQYRYAITHPVVLADGRNLVKLGKYYFGSLDINSQRLSQNRIPPRSLYIGRPQEADSNETINAPDDGRVIFKVFRTK